MKLTEKRKMNIFVIIAAILMSVCLNTVTPVSATATTTTDWKYPSTVTDNSWLNENNIKANDGYYAYGGRIGSSYYIQGTNFGSNFPTTQKAVTRIRVRAEVKRSGLSWMENPKIKFGYELAGDWHWSGTYVVTTNWVVKYVYFYPDSVIGTPKNIRIRVYIDSNPEGWAVQIDYLQCEVQYIIDPEQTYSPGNLGSDWGRHPTDQYMIDEANEIISACGNDPNIYDAAYRLWDHVKTKFTWTTPAIRTDLDAVNNDYNGHCYTAAIALSGLCRAVGIPSRIILYSFVESGTEHAFVEIYVGEDGWIPADADYVSTGGGFFGWSQYQSRMVSIGWFWYFTAPGGIPPGLKVDEIRWVYSVNGSATYANGEWKRTDPNGYYYDPGSSWDTYYDFKDAL